MRLFIAEKPSLAKAIAASLGDLCQLDYQTKNGYYQIGNDFVTYCFGHILELKEPHEYKGKEHLERWNLNDLPFSINSTSVELKAKENSLKQLKIIMKLLKEATEVVNAGDPDREGQLLIDEVLDYSSWHGETKRILIPDVNNVRKALQNLKPNSDYQQLYYSARARSLADWIYGLNLTRFYTLKAQENGYSGVISIGRVQTPILGLIVDRYKESVNHKPQDYYTLKVLSNNIEFLLQSEELIYNKDSILKIENNIQSLGEIHIEDVSSVRKKVSPPLPFSLVELQKKVAKDFGYSPQKVLDLVQKLYEEHKVLTYPRSDCSFLPEEHFNERLEVISAIEQNLGDITLEHDSNLKGKAWNDKKITAHHAIIPTIRKIDFSSLTKEEINVYKTVSIRYLLQFTSDYIYDATGVKATADTNKLKAFGNKIIQLGWKAAEENSEIKETHLPSIAPNIKLAVDEIKINTNKTKALPLFTDASLLDAIGKIAKHVVNKELMSVLKETSGIGTPATQATIIDNLFKRNFIKYQKKQIVPTPIGLQLIELLPEKIWRPDITAYWELLLAKIEDGTYSEDEFIKKLNLQVANILTKEKDKVVNIEDKNNISMKICPKCKKKTLKKGMYGFFCKEEECKFSLSQDLLGKKLTDTQIDKLLSGETIKNLKGLKKKNGEQFNLPGLKLDDEGKLLFLFKNSNKKTKN